jgi:3-deoxy-D-manno-octulosonate 8-phosphate phosphatase KdsC-like HAD superfamily phosphatase
MAYVGDDIFDTTIMREVGYAYCPRNVPRDVKDVCKVLDVNCGEDVVAFLYDYMVEKSMISKCKLSDVVNLDKLESF